VIALDPTRLAVLPFGDRLVAAAITRTGVQTFAVEAENPAAALRAELDQRRIRARNVSIGLPRSAVTVKPIELPTVDGELHEMVRFELERHLPYANEDTPFDFVPLPVDGGGTSAPRHVLIAAADRRVIDAALRVVEEAKLRPVSVTVAAHNLLAMVTRPRRGRIVWVHRLGQDAELLFIARGALVLSRSVTEATDEALVEEIRRSFTVTRWRGCDELWLSGDADHDVPGALADVGAPVAEPPFTPRARRQLAAITDSPLGVLELAVAVAAAGRTRPLELLPVALRPRRLTRSQLITVGIAAGTVLLAIAALLVPGYREDRRLADVNGRIARLDPEVREVEKVMQDLDRKRQLVATIQSIQTSTVRPLPVLRELTDLLPNDAWLTMLSLDTKGVELTGQAAAASALIPLLENSPRLERVEFSSPVTRGRDREQFRIRAAWEGGPGAVVAPASVAPPAAARPPVAAPPAAGRPGPPVPGSRPVPGLGAGPQMAPPVESAPAEAPTMQPRRPLGPGPESTR
jgi:Tfp pilus assembly protein PilN